MDWVPNAIQEHLPFTDPVVVFAVVMVIMLIAPMVMRRLRLPELIGLIVTGAVVGPNGLGVLQRGQTMELLGTVGLLYLMYMAGLSMDLNQFARQRGPSIGFGLASFFVPQTAGILAGLYLLDLSWLQAILLGSIVGSHTLLAFPIARRLGITRNRAVTAAMGGTIVTDALALLVLAGVLAVHAGDAGIAFWSRFLLLLICFVIIVVFGLPALGRWFFRNVQDRGDADYIFMLVALFLAAVLSNLVGLAPIVGAFIAGLSMNRLVPNTGPLMSRLGFVGEALFIPFFLLSVGMLVDFRVLLGSSAVWGIAMLAIVLVAVGKALAARLTQEVYRFHPDEGWTMAGLTIPQAAATLAVTLIGFDVGLFDKTMVNAVVVLMLASCLLGPWMVEHFGRRVALLDEDRADDPYTLPERILVPMANPATADRLMDIALMLRDEKTHEPIYPLTVARDGTDVDAQVVAGEKMLSHAVIHAVAAGAPVTPVTRVDESIANGIERAVRERRVTTVVFGWNGQITARQRILGSVLDQVLRNTPPQMLVCRFADAPLNTTRRVVFAVPRFADREPGFSEAVRTVKRLTRGLGAQLLVLTPTIAAERIGALVQRARPEVATSTMGIDRWMRLLSELADIVREDDLIVLQASREGRISWAVELNRLPRRIAARLPTRNYIILYPSELQREAPRRAAVPAAMLAAADRIVPELAAGEPLRVLEQIMRPHFADRLHVLAMVLTALRHELDQCAMTIRPGVVLVHGHVPRITHPTLFIGRSRAGLNLGGIAQNVRVLLILLSPDDLAPEDHLQVLSTIARMVGQASFMERIMSAESRDDMLAVVAAALDESPE